MFKRSEKHVTDADAIRSLPRNRKEVFFDLLAHRKMTLFSLSCFTFMFFIPLAIDVFVANFFVYAAIQADKPKDAFSILFYLMLIMIPLMMVGFLGFAGGFQTAKKLVWQEGISIAVDFFQGVKENWKRALINGFIFGLFLFGFIVGGSYLLIYSPTTPVWSGIGIGALIVFLLLFGMVVTLNIAQDVYYQTPFGGTFKNSFRFIALINWKVLVLYLLTTGVLIALCCLNLITLGIGLFLFAILNSVVIVLYTLICHSAFDKYINSEHYPEMVNKGLYKELPADKAKDKEA